MGQISQSHFPKISEVAIETIVSDCNDKYMPQVEVARQHPREDRQHQSYRLILLIVTLQEQRLLEAVSR